MRKRKARITAILLAAVLTATSMGSLALADERDQSYYDNPQYGDGIKEEETLEKIPKEDEEIQEEIQQETAGETPGETLEEATEEVQEEAPEEVQEEVQEETQEEIGQQTFAFPGEADGRNASDANLNANKVTDAVTPRGTRIDVFDYWIDKYRDENGQEYGKIDQNAPDNYAVNGGLLSNGINNGHLLLFGRSLSSESIAAEEGISGSGGKTYNNKGNWNGWTGKGSGPINGIVSSCLGSDGFPYLALNRKASTSGLMSNWKTGATSFKNYSADKQSESLAYLFDETPHEGKNAYTNVGNLLQIDSQGYYYYDSTRNFASLRDGMTQKEYESGTDGAQFVLYNTEAVDAAGNSPNGQFFPFNRGKDVFEDSGSRIVSKPGMKSDNSVIGHYFGLHMETRFVQQYGGHTNIEAKDEVTYEFSGDDDVWIFIDDVLVADLGGIHDAVSVDINFASGEIRISSSGGNKNSFSDYTSTLREQYRAAGQEKEVIWSKEEGKTNTFADNTYHTLDFFYLERGNVDSNMNLKYNLVSVPESSIIKVDQVGEAVEGARFSLYATEENYTVNEQAELLASGVTDSDGEFTLVDEEGYLISLNQLYDKGFRYFVLREETVPAGYRSMGNMNLYFPEGAKKAVLLSDNPWETGAYAIAKVMTKTGAQIELQNQRNVNLASKEEGGDGGLLFGVILQYQGGDNGELNDDQNWRPVYGDPVNGWVVEDSFSMDTLLMAAKSCPYVFTVDSSGSFRTEIEYLPGDMLSYYYMLEDPNSHNVKYTVGYYYTTADRIEDADAGNTFFVDSSDFEREFAASLYVPNISNRLYVRKTDDMGAAVNGALFSLYRDSDVTVAPDGTITVNTGAKSYETEQTADITQPFAASGVAVFRGSQGLEEGIYYLEETEPPQGYRRNTALIKVVVDNTGVYADAGVEDDGVTVRRSVGALVKSMIQFAVDDHIDATLHDIRTELFVTDQYFSGSGSSAQWIATGKTSHLQYDTEAILEYKPIMVDGTEQPLMLETDSGWARLKIQQCTEHKGSDTSQKTDLGEMDLTGLFSGIVMVQVENERVAGLTIRKEVQSEEGQQMPQGEVFDFTVAGAPQTAAAGKTFEAVRYDGQGEEIPEQVSFDEQGKTQIWLKAGEKIHIKNLPLNESFTVTEKEDENYRASVSVTGGPPYTDGGEGTVTISGEENAQIAFLNVYDPVGEFSFRKITKDGEGLGGAVFVLYRLKCTDGEHNHGANGADEIEVEEDGEIIPEYAYADCWEQTAVAISEDGTGAVSFRNVALGGTYRLVEAKAPGGYLVPGGQWIVTATDTGLTVTGSVGNPTAFDGKNKTIVNYMHGQLPFSGNTGIRSLLLGGILLMASGAAGGVWTYVRRRRERTGE